MPQWWNGRHVSLRSWCLKGRVGSSPTFGTTKWPISIVWLNAPHCRCGDRRFKSGIGRNRGSSHGWSQLSWMLVQSQRGIMKGSFLPSSPVIDEEVAKLVKHRWLHLDTVRIRKVHRQVEKVWYYCRFESYLLHILLCSRRLLVKALILYIS